MGVLTTVRDATQTEADHTACFPLAKGSDIEPASPVTNPFCILNSASAIHSNALAILAVRLRPYTAVPLVLAVRHRPHTAVPLWYWQSDISHTQQCPCGTCSQTLATHSSALVVLAVKTSPIHSNALVVLAVRHWPHTAVPLWYWQLDIGHTQQCPCGTGSQTSAIRSSTFVVLAVRQQNICCSPAQRGNLARPHSRSPQALR